MEEEAHPTPTQTTTTAPAPPPLAAPVLNDDGDDIDFSTELADDTAGELRPARSATYTYSKEQKLKRYHAILRDFMAHFHQRVESYPLERQFSDEALLAIEPKDIVDWMNVKMFGSIHPDFSGATPMSGSHHTLSFYRKGIGYFMPDGTQDWDTSEKRGNPTRSKEIRDFINKVKGLNDSGVATPSRTAGKKRSAEEDGEGDHTGSAAKARKKRATKQTKGAKKRAAPTSQIPVAEEVDSLLRQMHSQKAKFLRGLEQMSAAVERMKSDVETSYEVMIGQISNISTRVVTAPPPNASEDAPMAPIPRARNLFTVWHVNNRRLTPLDEDWVFPTKLTVIDAMHLWLLGQTATHTPPVQYLTVNHMKHVKGASDGFNKLRRLMKIARYLGLKAGYWCENWDKERIIIMWSKIWPSVASHLCKSQVNNEAKEGSMSYRTLINSISKNGAMTKEMADNPQILSDDTVGRSVTKSTEAAARGEQRDDNGEAEEVIDNKIKMTACYRNLELLWGIHHGKLNPLPADWTFPSQVSMLEVLHLWFLGEPERKIPPLDYMHSSYVTYIKSGTGYLSKLRCVMKVLKHHGINLGCWHDEDWDTEKITTLWHTVWDAVEDKIKFRQAQGRDGAVTWQSVYNRMHESGLIKEVNADKEKDAEEDKDADQDKETEQDLEEVQVMVESV